MAILAKGLAFLQRETGELLCRSHGRSAGRRNLPPSLSLYCWIWVF